MPVSFTLTEDDWMLAVRLHQRDLLAWRWTAVGLVFANVVLYFLRTGADQPLMLVAYLCGLTIAGVFFALVVFVVQPNQYRRSLRQTTEALGQQTVEITPEGLHGTTAISRSLRPWSFFQQWKEDELVFLLYLNNIQFILLPKRAFADPAPLEAMRGYLQALPRPQPKLPVTKLFLSVLIAGLAVAAVVQLVLLFS